MTDPADIARVLSQRLKFPAKPQTPALSPEAMRYALALHSTATAIAAMPAAKRAEVERACAVLGVTIPEVQPDVPEVRR